MGLEAGSTWSASHGTVGADKKGINTYDFGSRAILVMQERATARVPEHLPTPGGPWTIKFEPTPVCNFDCHTCPYRVANEVQLNSFMQLRQADKTQDLGLSEEQVMQTLEDLKRGGHTRGVHWSGGGEPLSWPYIMQGIMKSGEFAQVSIQTNGTRLDKLTANQKALGAIRLISVSIYGDSDESYQRVTGVPGFTRVKENVGDLVQLRNRLGLKTAINAKILVTPRNYMGLFNTIETYQTLGVDTISVRETQNYNIGSDEERPESVELSFSQKDELLTEIATNHAGDKLLASFAKTLTRGPKEVLPTSHCFNATHSHNATITPEGEVYLGDPESGVKEYCIGNINQNSWSEAWGSPKHIEVVKKMDEKQIAGGCPLDLCRHHIANSAVDMYLASEHLTPVEADKVMENFGAFL